MNACRQHAPVLVDDCDECVAVVKGFAQQARQIRGDKVEAQPLPAQPAKKGKPKSLEQARQDFLRRAREQVEQDTGIPAWFTTRKNRRAMKQAGRKRGAGWTKAGSRKTPTAKPPLPEIGSHTHDQPSNGG